MPVETQVPWLLDDRRRRGRASRKAVWGWAGCETLVAQDYGNALLVPASVSARHPAHSFEPDPATALHGGHDPFWPFAWPGSIGRRCRGRHFFQLGLLDFRLPAHGDYRPGSTIAWSRRSGPAHAPLRPRTAQRAAHRSLDSRGAEAAHLRIAGAAWGQLGSASQRTALLQ